MGQGPAAAQSTPAYAYATTNLNQRAGPGTQFPVLQVLQPQTQVVIYGCLSTRAWCEGNAQNTRGWLSAQYLRFYSRELQRWVTLEEYDRHARLPSFAFNLETYWGQHYRDRPFYAERARWLVPAQSPPVVPAVFYRELAPHGYWVEMRGRYVWVPRVGRDWQPYTHGRWAWNPRYGWTWVSYEPFGWATYHYGRWGYSERIGWFWVPGTQWAPAWVAWRGSGDYLAWAALPPEPDPSFSININIGTIPSYYWQAVPANAFLSVNLFENVIRDERRRRVVEETAPLGNVRIVNNVVVNNIIDADYVRQVTNQEVVEYDIALRSEGEATTEIEGETIEVYHPPLTMEETPAEAGPPEVTPIEVVAEESQTLGQSEGEATTEELVPPTEEAPAPATEAPPVIDGPAQPAEEAPVDTLPVEEPPPADAPPPPPEEEPPPPPPVDEPALPAEEAPPPPAEEPPPPPAEEPPPPPAEEPPPPPPAEEPPPPPAEEPPPPPEPEPCPEGMVEEEGVCVPAE